MVAFDKTDALAVEVAWMAYVGGYTQAGVAERYGLSRAKVNRLISQAHDSGYVHVFIDHSPHRLIDMGDRIAERYGLSYCTVVPDVGDGSSSAGSFAALGSAAAYLLQNRLNRGDVHTIGVTWGRSLAEMARQLPRQSRPALSVVSIMGSLTSQSAINPFDVVHRITDVTDARGFFIPAPFIADSATDKEVLMQQKGVREAMGKAREAEICCIGIAALCADQPMFVAENGLLDADQLAELTREGVAGELVGRFLDAEGRELDIDLNRRTLGLSLDELRERETIGVAGGTEKVHAIEAVLCSRVLTGLIVDENAAVHLSGMEGAEQSCRTTAAV